MCTCNARYIRGIFFIRTRIFNRNKLNPLLNLITTHVLNCRKFSTQWVIERTQKVQSLISRNATPLILLSKQTTIKLQLHLSPGMIRSLSCLLLSLKDTNKTVSCIMLLYLQWSANEVVRANSFPTWLQLKSKNLQVTNDSDDLWWRHLETNYLNKSVHLEYKEILHWNMHLKKNTIIHPEKGTVLTNCCMQSVVVQTKNKLKKMHIV